MEAIVMNTENSKANESNKFIYYFTDKPKSKSNPNIALVNLSIYYTWIKILNLHLAKINLKFLLQLGMMNLISLMEQILFQTSKTILNIILKNLRL